MCLIFEQLNYAHDINLCWYRLGDVWKFIYPGSNSWLRFIYLFIISFFKYVQIFLVYVPFFDSLKSCLSLNASINEDVHSGKDPNTKP